MTTKPIIPISDQRLAEIRAEKLWSFHGGIHPQENKQQSTQTTIKDAGIPPILVIAVEHKDYTPELLVKVGDPVLKGQPLTKVYGAMVVQHASSSGVVSAIEKRTDLHPSGLPVLSIVIATDGLDKSIDYTAGLDYKKQENAQLLEQIQNAGIVGLGGATFPTHLKLNHPEKIKLLIINGAECEPYITTDDRLMREHSDEILAGINVLQHILQPQLTVIAVEDNKPEAIKALQFALQKSPQENIVVRSIPTHYPSGSAKQLIEIITGRQTPVGKHSRALGIVMQNVATAFAIKEAIIDGKPLISRIVTITGDAFQEKGNVNVRLGTPIQYLLEKYKHQQNTMQNLIIGGPLMGFTISHGDIPVTKACNCILSPTQKEMPSAPPEMPCIRCGECAEVCPAQLLPQQLLWYAKGKELDKLSEYNLSSCIECGACAYVCPSHIPLVEYYRVAKAEIDTTKQSAEKAENARLRFEKRQARLEKAKQERKEKHKQAAEKRKQQLKTENGGEDLIAAALARAKAKKASNEKPKTDNQNSAVAAAVTPAKVKKQTLSEIKQIKPIEKKSDAVAAAVARAKAKKQALAETKQANPTENNDAVAAAVARAKAKKQALAETKKADPTEKKNDAVAAAVARAKAKKQALAETKKAAPTEKKNDAVAAAVARAKAKKALAETKQATISEIEKQRAEENSGVIAAREERKQQARLHKEKKTLAKNEQETPSQQEQTIGDDRQAKIAAAIAKAKAKKAAQKDQ